MQDPYQHIAEQYKAFQINLQSNASASPPATANSNCYVDMQYGSANMYQCLPAAPMSHGYASIPAHVPTSSNPMNSSTGISTTRAAIRTAETPHGTSSLALMASGMNAKPAVSSPEPSGSNANASPDHQGAFSGGHMSSMYHCDDIKTESNSIHRSTANSENREDSSTAKKRPSNEEKDDNYLEKRRKNNESAKRSRESRKTKEEQLVVYVACLEEENVQLRTVESLYRHEIARTKDALYNS